MSTRRKRKKNNRSSINNFNNTIDNTVNGTVDNTLNDNVDNTIDSTVENAFNNTVENAVDGTLNNAVNETFLNKIEDDKTTIIVEAPQAALQPETDLNKSRRSAKGPARYIYAFFAILAPVMGTVTGLICTSMLNITHIYSTASMTQEELDEMSGWGWLAEFSSPHAQADYVSSAMTAAIFTGLAAIASVIILSIMTGRLDKADRRLSVNDAYADNAAPAIRLNWFDRLWSELQLALMICAAVAAVCLAIVAGQPLPFDNHYGLFDFQNMYVPFSPNEYWYGMSNETVFWYCTVGMAACLAVCVVSWLSLVRKAKAYELIHCSLLGRILEWLGWGAYRAGSRAARAGAGLLHILRLVSGQIKSVTRGITIPADTDRLAVTKLRIKYSLCAVGLVLLPFIMFFLDYNYYTLCLGLLISILLSVILVSRKVNKLTEIRAGVIEVKNGNLSYKIPVTADENGPKTDLDKLASDINHISEATNAAVQNEIKNQRMKTDLISNVSHDLKTPLTSMISYLDIIEKEGLDSPDAPAHLAIVREKTDRLKTLTDELFEAAKASSGNIPCDIADIDLAALIDQSLAEMEERLSRSNLTIKKNIRTDDTMVRADGKLLYRVLENLLSNICKYALEGSRVYIDVSEPYADGKLLLEIKNISRDELNISPDELMERFTRGDQSRATEGSGLGLAISKDLTNLMGGAFDIKIDGDMFKAQLLLPRA